MNTKNFGTMVVRGNVSSSARLKAFDGTIVDSWGKTFWEKMILWCGTNTIAPTVLDYTFTKINDLGDGFNNSITWATTNYETSINALLTISTTYQNNTANDIIVSEVGLITSNGSSPLSDSNTILLAREVLENPVTVPAGESYTFSMTII